MLVEGVAEGAGDVEPEDESLADDAILYKNLMEWTNGYEDCKKGQYRFP